VSPLPAGADAVLLDVEGTTTPLAFVTKVLFPYVREHLRAHLEQHATSDDYASILGRLGREHHASLQRGETPPAWVDGPTHARIASAVEFVEWLMDRDVKSTPLKELQGRIWEDGYRQGALVGQVFPDVPPALRRWNDQSLNLGIFSSGSVLAQRLLFQHSSAGDLTRLLHAFFDTNVGAKIDPDSYRRIAQRLGRPVNGIVFLSDTPRELDAARAAGMPVRLVIRPGNAPSSPDHDHIAIHGFDGL
jgi:enolase-phosphatase E1